MLLEPLFFRIRAASNAPKEPEPVQPPKERHENFRGSIDYPSQEMWRMLHQEYEPSTFINSGRDGTILKRAIQKATGRIVALKIIPAEDPKGRARALQEGEILRQLVHPNVVQLYDMYESAAEIVLVLEYCDGGDYLDILNSVGRFSEDECRALFYQLVSGLAYCHSKNIVHRDVKLDNLGLSHSPSGPVLKLLDFGFADYYVKHQRLSVSCGTLEYAAPELLRPRDQVSYAPEAIDIWSAGVVLYSFVCGCLPFEATSNEEFLRLVNSGTVIFPEGVASPALQQLIPSMLTVDPTKRPLFKHLRDDKWVCGVQKKNPTKHETPSPTGSDPDLARKRPKTKQPSFWKSILHSLKIVND